jgi:hypothetical protein
MLPTQPPESSTYANIAASLLKQNVAEAYLENIIGAAVFDLQGLPKHYFSTVENPNTAWTQTIFQMLGLKSLLALGLGLENFQYAVMQGDRYTAVVLNQRSQYLALLVTFSESEISESFIHWAQELPPELWHQNSRFQAA